MFQKRYSGEGIILPKTGQALKMVYVNPDIDAYWIVDYRIYDPDRDGKSKIDHLPRSDRDSKQLEMLRDACYAKHLPFTTVLVDSWYASRYVLRYIEQLEKVYYSRAIGLLTIQMPNTRTDAWIPSTSMRPNRFMGNGYI